MKTFITVIFLSLFAFFLTSCGCDDENPTVQLTNNGTAKADIQIKTSGGNTENINNILTGTSSERRSFAPGTIVFTIAIQGVNENIVYTLESASCYDYSVVINPDNSVSSKGDER